jgi:hypothetical protein
VVGCEVKVGSGEGALPFVGADSEGGAALLVGSGGKLGSWAATVCVCVCRGEQGTSEAAVRLSL